MNKLIKWTLLFVFTSCLSVFAQNASPEKTFSTEQMKEDLSILKKTLITIHPGVYRYQTPKSLEKLFADAEAKLKKPLSENAFFLLISQLTNQIHCGHTYLNPYNQKAALRERVSGRKTYFPFYFKIINGKILITENASASNLAKGSEILKINGVPARKIIEKLLSVTHADGKNTFAHSLQQIELQRFEAERFALFDWYFHLFFPLKDEFFNIEAIDSGTKKKTNFKTPALTKIERTAEIERRYGKAPTYDDGWKFEIRDDSVAYLKMANSITWRLKQIKFKEFLANAFSLLHQQEIKNLIIDLRGNDGGDTDVGFELAKYLAKIELPPYIASRRLVRNVAPQMDLIKYLDTYSDELKSNLKNGLPINSYKKADSVFFEILPNEKLESYPHIVPNADNFSGKTYIISDASNASATFQFLNYAKENHLATIVGQETGGNRQGINGGNYFFLYLPHSQLEIDIPVYYFAPFRPQPDESVIPDFAVKSKSEDIAKGIDAELDYVKKLIQAKKD